MDKTKFIHQLIQQLKSARRANKPTVLLETISKITPLLLHTKTGSELQALVESNDFRCLLVKCLSLTSDTVPVRKAAYQALMTLGLIPQLSFVTKGMFRKIIESGIVPHVIRMLEHPNRDFSVRALEAIAHIVKHGRRDELMSLKLIPGLLSLNSRFKGDIYYGPISQNVATVTLYLCLDQEKLAQEDGDDDWKNNHMTIPDDSFGNDFPDNFVSKIQPLLEIFKKNRFLYVQLIGSHITAGINGGKSNLVGVVFPEDNVNLQDKAQLEENGWTEVTGCVDSHLAEKYGFTKVEKNSRLFVKALEANENSEDVLPLKKLARGLVRKFEEFRENADALKKFVESGIVPNVFEYFLVKDPSVMPIDVKMDLLTELDNLVEMNIGIECILQYDFIPFFVKLMQKIGHEKEDDIEFRVKCFSPLSKLCAKCESFQRRFLAANGVTATLELLKCSQYNVQHTLDLLQGFYLVIKVSSAPFYLYEDVPKVMKRIWANKSQLRLQSDELAFQCLLRILAINQVIAMLVEEKEFEILSGSFYLLEPEFENAIQGDLPATVMTVISEGTSGALCNSFKLEKLCSDKTKKLLFSLGDTEIDEE